MIDFSSPSNTNFHFALMHPLSRQEYFFYTVQHKHNTHQHSGFTFCSDMETHIERIETSMALLVRKTKILGFDKGIIQSSFSLTSLQIYRTFLELCLKER